MLTFLLGRVRLRACPSGSVVVPSTSLGTLPVVFMGGTAAARPAANIEMLPKMRYVVVEE